MKFLTVSGADFGSSLQVMSPRVVWMWATGSANLVASIGPAGFFATGLCAVVWVVWCAGGCVVVLGFGLVVPVCATARVEAREISARAFISWVRLSRWRSEWARPLGWAALCESLWSALQPRGRREGCCRRGSCGSAGQCIRGARALG